MVVSPQKKSNPVRVHIFDYREKEMNRSAGFYTAERIFEIAVPRIERNSRITLW